MESETRHSPPIFNREVRLGLIAASGLSLSSYTSGVCQEFYRAVRGRGIYKLLKALVDADLIVDTISGTSAGGLNAVLLSYALTNSTTTKTVDFSVFNEIWQNNADIYQLLHQPTAATGQLLDGNGYHQQQLEAAFVNAFQHRVSPSEREWVSSFRELDLLVTSTDFWGKTYRQWDDGGALTLVQDHAALFHLKHRQCRKEPFNPIGGSGAKPQDTFQALAKLCRLTSALPVVFPPVQVDLNNPHNLVDRQLGIWGQLECRYWQHRPEGKQISFLDGSLLGQPLLEPATRTMYYRTPDRWTQRILFYTAPVLGQWQAPVEMLDQPLSQSMATDLRQVQEHNQKVQRYQELLAVAEKRVSSSIDNSELQLQCNIYRRSRLINFRTQAIPLLLRLATGSDHDRQLELARIYKLLADHQVSAVDKEQREACLQNFAPQMVQLDVDYSLRHHFYLTHKIHEQLVATKSPNERFYLEVLIRRIGQSIQLLEVIKASLQQLLSNVVISDNFYAMLGVKKSNYFLRPLVYEYIFRLHRYLLDVQVLPLLLPSRDELPTHWDEAVSLSELFLNLPLTANETQSEWLPSAQISTIWRQLQQKIEILATAANQGQYLWNKHRFHYDQRENKCFLSILTQIESATTMLLHNSPTAAAQLLLHQFQSFEQLDRVLYPLEYLTDLDKKEPLHTVCISPATAQLGWSQDKSAPKKLAGHNFYLAGGFFNKSWHVNDLLWGRLDGLDRMMAGIISPVTIQYFSGLVQRESMRLAMTPADYLDFLLTESLPHVVDQERQQIKAHLTYLAQPNLEITAEQLRDRLQDLVMAGHRQILTTDLDQAGQNTASQEKMWGIQNYQALTHSPLQSSMMQMAQAITQESLENLAAEQQQFFRKQYKVGSEQLFENTPGMVWINWLSRLVLALRDLAINYLGKLRVNRLVRNFGDQLLDSWYWWLQSRGIKLVLKISRQRLRLLLRRIFAILLMLAVVLTTFNPMIWLVVGVVALVGWGVLAQRLGRRRRQPHKFQKLLAVKSLVDR